jgi:[protein-PII] uridylyltransferase
MPARYWLTTSPEQVVEHLTGFRQLQPNDVVVLARPVPDRGTFNYTVCTEETVAPGIFSKLAGVLAAKGLQILGAQVYTRGDGTIVDSFEVLDPDYHGPPPPRRIEAVRQAIRDVLQGRVTIQELFAKSRRVGETTGRLVHQSAQVEVDNDSSDEFTILDVFADDRQGLLFVITNAIFEAGLSVHSAKISTRLDQIADVFYVTTREGGKLTDSDAVARLKERLTTAVSAHLDHPI